MQIAAHEAQKHGWKIDDDDYLADLGKECEQLARGHQWLQNSNYETKVKFIKFEDGVTQPQKLEDDVAKFVQIHTDRVFVMEEKQQPNKYQKSVQGALQNFCSFFKNLTYRRGHIRTNIHFGVHP